MLGTGVLYLIFENSITSRSRSRGAASTQFDYVSRSIMGFQVGIIILAILVTRSSVASLQAKKGLPLGNQVTGWLVLITSLGLPFLHRIRPNSHYLHRLLVIFLAFSPSFVLLTISYEGLFYVAFCTTLMTWVRLEHSLYVQNKARSGQSSPAPSTVPDTAPSPATIYRTLTLSDARIALFFLFLLQSAFFSTGNIASVSSFSLDAVYRLIPIFDPFAQGALLMFKILVPFAIISANLGILNRRLGVAPSALFMLVMAISDVMTLHFFWTVKDEGSWLDIGTTISHFVIASLLCVFVAGLEFVSEVLISGVEVDGQDTQQIDGAERKDTEISQPLSSVALTKEWVQKPGNLANGHSVPNGVAQGTQI